MPDTPDLTPNLYADARDDIIGLHGDKKNPNADYGTRGVKIGAGAIDISVAVEPVVEVPEQLDIFSMLVEEPVAEKPKAEDSYGHVKGASAGALRAADQAYIRSQSRGK